MLILKGKSIRKFDDCIGIITRKKLGLFNRKDYIYVSDRIDITSVGYLGVLSSKPIKKCFYMPDGIENIENIDILQDGDIVNINSDGLITILWQKNSFQNLLFLTESCNCRCLMCPQPPKKHDENLVKIANRVLDLIKIYDVSDICISGGEPTLLKDKFIHILRRCVTEYANANINILTNGKVFENKLFTEKVSSVASNNVMFCVSLHSNIPEVHDKIVGAKGSFIKTINGIYNLAQYGKAIEIRIVVNKLNYNSLSRIAEYLSNYIPFCVHYVFMGMEVHGIAIDNFEEINAYPYEYRNELREAVLLMYQKGLPVSVYNVPLCMIDYSIRRFAERSISEWKNMYLTQCESCTKKNNCCGFFETSKHLALDFIRPL